MKSTLLGLVIAGLLLPGAPPVGAQDPARRAATDLGLRIDPDKPLDISANEFEAARVKGVDVFTFRGNVRAVQEALELVCDSLDATYSEQGGSAERILARGSVRMSQDQTEVRCDELIYERSACRVTCKGEGRPAFAARGEDTIRGQQIEVDLCKGTLKVKGRASIALRPGSRPPSGTAVPKPDVSVAPGSSGGEHAE